MQALLGYLKTASIPLHDRPSVSDAPVRSVSVGLVNRRQCGYGISAATVLDQLRLTRLLVGVAEDPAIAGEGPSNYTSVCLNVDYPCDLHADAWNAGDSWIVTMGDHVGGHLFIEKDAQEDREVECSIDHADLQVHGCSVDVSRRWYRFQGRQRHCTLPYSGLRVRVVYFSVPLIGVTVLT